LKSIKGKVHVAEKDKKEKKLTLEAMSRAHLNYLLHGSF
jgi:hypothetical protein